MYSNWTKNDIKESWQRFYCIYRKCPVEYRFLCGHDIQSEDDDDALDYYIIGVWLVKHRKYKNWSKEKSFDLAEILDFMRQYKIKIPRYIRRTGFYRKKCRELLERLHGFDKDGHVLIQTDQKNKISSQK